MTPAETNKTLPVTMNADEVDYFKKLLSELPPAAKMVEWGSGGSTELFLDYFGPGRQLISIEHNQEWYDKVTKAVENHPNRKNLTYLFIPPEVDLRFYGYGVPNEENPCFNQEYINPELAFDDVKIWDANIFLIDGISRGACLATVAVKSIFKESKVFIHDYKGREKWYDWATGLYTKKEIVASTLTKLTY